MSRKYIPEALDVVEPASRVRSILYVSQKSLARCHIHCVLNEARERIHIRSLVDCSPLSGSELVLKDTGAVEAPATSSLSVFESHDVLF